MSAATDREQAPPSAMRADQDAPLMRAASVLSHAARVCRNRWGTAEAQRLAVALEDECEKALAAVHDRRLVWRLEEDLKR